MRTYNLILKGLYLTICIIFTLSSCKQNYSGFSVDPKLTAAISKYVTCPEDSVEMMLTSSDSICQLVDTCSLEFLDLYDRETNRYLDSLYRKEIPVIMKIYGTYDVVTTCPTSEANAAFAWYEVATALIAEYYGKEKVDTTDAEKLFRVIDDILGSYAAGTQREMNVSSCRRIMMSDYRIIGAYKALYDCCKEPSLLKSIHDSYVNLLEMYRNRCDQIEGYWSDLPRELAWMQIDMMDKRRETIEKLHTSYSQGKISVQEVKAELDKRPEDVEWDIYDY